MSDNPVNASTEGKKCLSWITRSGEKLNVSTPKLLQRSTSALDKFLNFITILGPARQGKSFVMNCLIGDRVFLSSNKMDVCTKGVHVASVMHRIENGGCAFFVDTEGQGDEGIESDATLLTPILLLSKVILFNWKGGLQKNKILNELALLVEVANRVSSNSLERPKFGHLHIVLRDFHFEGTDEEALAKIFDEEVKRGEDVNQRNKVREKLRSSFESIKVFTLPIPSENVSNLDLRTTSEEFQTRIEELKSIISGQLKEPRSFGNFVVNFENVDDLVKTFAQNLENGDIVNVKSVVRQLQRGTVDKAKRCFEENLIKAYKVIDTSVKQGLKEQLIKKRDALLDEFSKTTAQVDLEKEYVDNVLQDLKTWASMRLKDKVEVKEKEEKSNQQICLMKAVENFRSAVEVELLRQGETDIPSLRKNFQQKKAKILEIFRNSTRGLHLVTQRTEEELRKLESSTAKKFEEKVEAVEREKHQRKSDAKRQEHKDCSNCSQTSNSLGETLISQIPPIVGAFLSYYSSESSSPPSQQQHAKERYSANIHSSLAHRIAARPSESGSMARPAYHSRSSGFTQKPRHSPQALGTRFQNLDILSRPSTSSSSSSAPSNRTSAPSSPTSQQQLAKERRSTNIHSSRAASLSGSMARPSSSGSTQDPRHPPQECKIT